MFRLCRKDEISFDIVAETGNIVAKNGDNVEATFAIVERIVQLVAFDNVAWTLMLVWTGLNAYYVSDLYEVAQGFGVSVSVAFTGNDCRRVSVMSSRTVADGFLRFHQLLHTSGQPECSDRGDGQHDLSTST